MALFDILKRKPFGKAQDKKEKEDKKQGGESKEKIERPVEAKTPIDKKITAGKKTSSAKTAKDKKEEKALKPATLRIDQTAAGGERLASIILKPRITEKASYITADGAYTFIVDPRANKIQIKKAIEEIFGVKPMRVNIINVKPKQVMVRNRRGFKRGIKKAVVYLKEGDRIEFV